MNSPEDDEGGQDLGKCEDERLFITVGLQGTASPDQQPSDREPSDLSSDEFPVTQQIKLSTKKISNMVSGKRGGKAGHLLRATPRKKAPQEKKSSGGSVSKIVLGRKSQAHLSGCLPGPATFPPISGFPVFARAEKHSLIPCGPTYSKHNTGKKPVANKSREPELGAQEDAKPSKEAAPKGQLLASRPGPSCLSVHHGLCNSGDSKTKMAHVPGSCPHLGTVQGGVRPRVLPPSGDQGLPLHILRQERSQPLPGTQCCLQCSVLQKEIDSLKDQIVAMQCIMDKFQIL